MRKLIFTIIALTLLLCTAGCASSKPNAAEDTEEAKQSMDVPLFLATDLGMNPVVAEELNQLHPDYSPYLGGITKHEDDGVWVYEHDWVSMGDGSGNLIYTKYSPVTEEVVERTEYLVKGDQYKLVNTDPTATTMAKGEDYGF